MKPLSKPTKLYLRDDKQLKKIMLYQLKEGAIDDPSYTKQLTKKQLNQLASHYAKQWLESE